MGPATFHDWDAVAIACSPQAALRRASTVVDDVVGNRDGVPDPNETLDLQIAVTNAGAVAATGVTGTLSSATPGVVVLQATSSYPDIAPGTRATNLTPFTIALDSTFTRGQTILLTLQVHSNEISATVDARVTTARLFAADNSGSRFRG